MDKNELQSIDKSRRLEISEYIQRVKIASSEQIARGWFMDYGSPAKRASEYLKKLEEEHVLESFPRGFKPSLYRLSKQTKQTLGDTSYQTPFTKRIDHRLYLAEILLHLSYYHIPPKFYAETRQEFEWRNQSYKYSPDIICTWLGHWWTIEAQRSPMESKKWARKWEVHKAFWESGAYKKADWQPDKLVKPRLVVISNQQADTVTTGCGKLEIQVVRTITDLYNSLTRSEKT